MESSKNALYDRPISKDELRILTLNHEETKDEIQCELNVFNRDAKPRYTALSYCWGPDDQNFVTVKIGQHTLKITEELATALGCLLKHYGSMQLWVDAICIIQKPHEYEKEDKDAQIVHMDRTYAEAAAVVVWLGASSGEEQSALAMKAIDQLGSQLDGLVPGNVRDAALELLPVDGNEPRKYILAIGKLLDRPWFHRLWTVQEVCLAPFDLTLMCGKDVVPFWKLLYLQLHPRMHQYFLDFHTASVMGPHALHKSMARSMEPPLGLTRHLFLEDRKRKHVKHLSPTERSRLEPVELEQLGRTDLDTSLNIKCTLLSHLWTFRNRECTQQEDRVYGVLGMTRDISKETFAIDTGKSPDDVSARAARAIIEKHRRLDVLGMCFPTEHELQSTGDGRPSWVPDLRSNPGVRPLLPLTWYQPSKDGETSAAAFRAARSSSAIFTFSENLQELTVRGRRIGVIKDSGYHGVQPETNAVDGATQALIKARRLAEGLQVPGRDVIDELWRTLAANRATESGRSGLKLADQFQLWWEMFLDPANKPEPEKQKKASDFTSAFNQYYQIRDFFITDRGQMGLCPLTRAMDDVVVLLAGAQVAFALRPHGQKFRVVGECYVHGAMNGEMWDDRWTESSLEPFCLI